MHITSWCFDINIKLIKNLLHIALDAQSLISSGASFNSRHDCFKNINVNVSNLIQEILW